VLTSARNPRVLAAAALHDARTRRREGLHLAEGARVCREALTAGAVVEVFHTGGHDELRAFADPSTRWTSVEPHVMARISDATTPPGIVAVVTTPDLGVVPAATGHVLVLDGVSDPGNVGTLLRTAAAHGAAVVSVGGADPFGPKAVRASAGTVYRTSIHRPEAGSDLAGLLRGQGRPVLGLAADGPRTLAEAAADAGDHGIVLAVGSEPHGLGDALRDILDGEVRIPMQAGVESLNVAVAGAIAMHVLMGA
jgi:TrmH family RNA methyltransferase